MINLVERQVKKFLEKRRPPVEIRDELDIGYSYENNTLEIFEIRPQWNDKNVIRHHPIARAKLVKSKNVWKVYWMRANLKWAAYQPEPEVKGVERFLEIVDQDAFGCFFG